MLTGLPVLACLLHQLGAGLGLGRGKRGVCRAPFLCTVGASFHFLPYGPRQSGIRCKPPAATGSAVPSSRPELPPLLAPAASAPRGPCSNHLRDSPGDQGMSVPLNCTVLGELVPRTPPPRVWLARSCLSLLAEAAEGGARSWLPFAPCGLSQTQHTVGSPSPRAPVL